MSRTKYIPNDTYFDKIDTEQKAYWLGFLYADGYNNETKREVKIRLQRSDESHLLKLRDAIYPDAQRPLYYRRNSCELYIANAHMSRQLKSLGCMQAKTFKVHFPFDAMPAELYSHFIREVFDGDGSIVLSTLKSGAHKTMFSIIGNRPFMSEINHVIASSCGIGENQLIDYKGKDERIATVIWSGCRQCIKIREYLYNNATIFLQRKRDKFDKLGTNEWKTYENLKHPQVRKPRKLRKGRFKTSEYIDNADGTTTLVLNHGTQEYHVLIDTNDKAIVDTMTWHIENGRVVSSQRIIGTNKKKMIYLCRLIMNAIDGQSVKHLDNNPMNCCKNNLLLRNHR